MSKQKFKKFRKNDWSTDDDNYEQDNRNRVNKYDEKRLDRALRTKDISILDEEDEDDLDFEDD